MAINYFEMFAQLKMGVDIAPDTDYWDVPGYPFPPGHVPVYHVEREVAEGEWKRIHDVPEDFVELVEWMHGTLESVRLMEDGCPVFTAD